MIYICGDSFGVPDPEYGTCWTELLAQRLPVKNLCKVSASNFAISEQIQQAISEQAKYIIALFTSSVRQDTVRNGQLISYSIYSLGSTAPTPFSQIEIDTLKRYTTEFFDLRLAIKLNQIIIEHTLNQLISSDIPFVFDQGGFDHKKFGGRDDYFKNFNSHRSQHNLWDYAENRYYRPYFHITDAKIHQKIADYYESRYRQT